MQREMHLSHRGVTPLPLPVSMVVLRCADGTPHFDNLWAGRAVVAELDHLHRLGYAYTLGYVLLPDRLGWMVRLGRPWSLREVIRRLQQRSAHRLDRTLWHPGFQHAAVSGEADLPRLAWRLVEMAVKNGLAASLGDYALWDHAYVEYGARPLGQATRH